MSLSGVSVAIPSWNGLEQLRECLPAVRDQSEPGCDWEVLVLDNGSKDGTGDWLRREFSSVRVVTRPRNIGFCAGANTLARAARFEAFALLNNDARPEPNWLSELVRAIEQAPPDVAAVSGLIVDWEGQRLDFGRGVMTFDGHAFQLDQGRPLGGVEIPATGQELLFACGGNMLIRRDSFLDLGGFDEDYFAYLEDVDLGWRIWASGQRVWSAPEARVRHRSMATSDRLGVFNRGQLFERNAFLTAYKNYDDELWGKLMPAVLFTLTSRSMTMLVDNNAAGRELAFDPFAGGVFPTGAESVEAPGGHFWRQVARRLGRRSSRPVELDDPRSIAQLRATAAILRSMDADARKRSANQARRTLSDREIFERFPLYVVPTYPGDEALFESAWFQAALPEDVPLIRCRLDEVIQTP